MQKQCVWKIVWEWVLIFVGALLVAVSTELFLSPNKVVLGGISGISTMLYHATGISIGVSYFIMNSIILMIAFKVLGKAFVFKTLIVVAITSGCSVLVSGLPACTENIFLATLYGGLLYGAGLAILFTRNATSGGTDVIGRLIQCKVPDANIGRILMMLDGSITCMSLIVFGKIDLCLWGFIARAVCNGLVDMWIAKLNSTTVYVVITQYGDQIMKFILDTYKRGSTIIDYRDANTNDKRKIIVCAVKKRENMDFYSEINRIDPEVFIVHMRSDKIEGSGLQVYH